MGISDEQFHNFLETLGKILAQAYIGQEYEKVHPLITNSNINTAHELAKSIGLSEKQIRELKHQQLYEWGYLRY